VDRREFLALSAAAAAFPRRFAGAADDPPGANPFARAMRWGQLAFVENDPGRYDLKFWVDYFRRAHLDAVCLSAGGVVAFYPTKIPFHYKSAWMKDGMDPFGELTAACRKQGLLVLARVDPHAVDQPARDAHPEWIAVDEKGQKRPALGQPGAVGHLRVRPPETSST
jgi:hypothetical protein